MLKKSSFDEINRKIAAALTAVLAAENGGSKGINVSGVTVTSEPLYPEGKSYFITARIEVNSDTASE